MFVCVCVCDWQMDYYYEYTECDSTGSRWRVAIPQSPGACTGLPEPVRGTECSKSMCESLYSITTLEFLTQKLSLSLFG